MLQIRAPGSSHGITDNQFANVSSLEDALNPYTNLACKFRYPRLLRIICGL